MTKETEQFEDATSVDPTVDQQELARQERARQAFMRQELAEREELVKQMTLCFLQKKLEVEIYAEDLRPRSLADAPEAALRRYRPRAAGPPTHYPPQSK